ncbi:uncharacterized protein K452DRAFT_40247 [Aplosporella prunicola CBS 121167]|uniref:Uncharacterized protein n=1 Tax=Aplosporella prunicola CBS 121167 TaxID=1176127 RepID=A0A6A6BBK6_9PEZI|nr:uncharacterized protein K452DRAFT_40247 [Aplosporella prunicola CBS 121167]KAF2141500.1 hypothetical protein K452DRAFT_40247 [Aplosporella prunicola CBS 121167]
MLFSKLTYIPGTSTVATNTVESAQAHASPAKNSRPDRSPLLEAFAVRQAPPCLAASLYLYSRTRTKPLTLPTHPQATVAATTPARPHLTQRHQPSTKHQAPSHARPAPARGQSPEPKAQTAAPNALESRRQSRHSEQHGSA